MADVIFYDDDGNKLADLYCKVADDSMSRYQGLSEYDSLPEGQGMIFLYKNEEERTFIMRDMDFDLDIIFANSDGEVTDIYSAEAPDEDVPDRSLTEYTGVAQAVVETNRGFAAENDIRENQCELRLELE